MQSLATPGPYRRTCRVTWTSGADTRLTGLYAEGLSLRGIAKAMCLSRNAVVERATRLGVHNCVPMAERKVSSVQVTEHLGAENPERDPLPAGHPISWGLLTAGTSLEGTLYQIPKLPKSDAHFPSVDRL